MSSFSVPVTRVLSIEPIEGADRIEVAKVLGYQSIVQKDTFRPGDLVAYIPEQALVPLDLLKEMGLEGRLAGPDHNRVKAIKLKKVLSQGLLYHAQLEWNEGDNVAAILGITKYEPPIPVHMAGQIRRPRGNHQLLKYDIENIKSWPDVLQPEEHVYLTEKIHGTLMQAVYWPGCDQFAVSSKGLGGRGFIVEDNEANQGNVYIQAAKKYELKAKLDILCELRDMSGYYDEAIFVVGEVFGKGIQDLNYAADLEFRVFDIYFGNPGNGHFVDARFVRQFCRSVRLEPVPMLYYGPFSPELVEAFTKGTETVSGSNNHIREGIVIRPEQEREHRKLGRVILKSINPDYLLRKGGTEFN